MKRIRLLFAVLVIPAAPVRGEDLAQFKTADDLWTHINQLEMQVDRHDPAQFSRQVEDLRGALVEFQARCPTNDSRRWDAKLLMRGAESMRAEIQRRPQDWAGMIPVTEEILAAPDAS